MCPLIAFSSSFDFFGIVKRPCVLKASGHRSPIGRGPGPRAPSRMRGGGALAVSWFWCQSRGRGQSSGFILQRRSLVTRIAAHF